MLTELVANLSLPPLVYVALTLMVILVVKSWLDTPSNLPPCPVRPYPIVGHIPYLKNNPREKMKQWREKVGDVFTLYMGPSLMVVLNGYSVLKETLVKQADHFTDRPVLYMGRVRDDVNVGLLGSSGPMWKEQRSVSLNILRSFGMGKNSLAEKIQEEVCAYLDELGRLKGEASNVRTLTNISVSNIICSIIVGQRFQYDDPYFKRFMDLFNEQVLLLSGTSYLNSFPWLRYLPGDMFKAKKVLENDEAVLSFFCDRYIEQSKDKFDEANLDNFIAAYLKEMKSKKDKGEITLLSEKSLRRVIQNLFVAGTETTSTTMLWFMLYMLRHPEIQKKIYKEIEDVVGTERMPSMQDKSKLVYLNAAIMETQRLADIVPFSLLHLCTADVTINGYTIPKGTTIMPVLDSVLLDEKIWGDPLNFRPERFLDSKGNLLHPDEFLPFSLGRRVCLGESLAKMELLLYLSALMQRFELQPSTPNQPPLCKAVFGVTCPPEAYKLRFIERRKS